MDPGCDFTENSKDDGCGATPTRLFHLGSTVTDPGQGSGWAGDVLYAHYCEAHLAVMQERLGHR